MIPPHLKTMKRTFSLLMLSCLVFVLGCQSSTPKPDGLPKLQPCRITVTQADKPLEGALVRLERQSPGKNWQIDGMTDANGVATLKTSVHFSGAPEGEYKVLISKVERTLSAFPEEAPKDPAEYRKWSDGRASEELPSYDLVQVQYKDASRTPHSINIVAGDNTATFDVDQPIREQIGGKKKAW